MEKTLALNWLKEKQTGHFSLARGIGWGLLGGLVGTLVMDILLMSGLSAMSLPAFTCFTIVGDTVAKFFSLFDFEVAGDIPTGAATHYVIGPLVGAIYGAGVAKIKAFRAKTVKRCLLQAIVYVEILSQPILAMTPILLKMDKAETWQWFGFSFVMHMILGAVLGWVVGLGVKRAGEEIRNSYVLTWR